MVVLVMFSAYFSATETAFSSINKTRLKTMAEKGNESAELVCTLAENYDKLLSTILIGNNIVNIGLASLGTVLFVKLLGDAGATVSTAVITVVVLIFGEVTPKSVAKDRPESFAIFSAPFLRFLIWLFTPLNFLFGCWKKLVSRIFTPQKSQGMSQEELMMLVEEVQQDGSIDEGEGDLLKNVIEFTDRRAEEILTHRVDVEAVSVEDSEEEVAKVFRESQFSRLLVYDDTMDNIVGVIHQKDFFARYGNGMPYEKGSLIRQIMAPPIFIQKAEKISNILNVLKAHKSHLAVVVDEYGGMLGIVTMEDILEELVGEIWDEHDEVIENFKKTGENVYLVNASVSFEEFCEFFDLEAESESISAAGWVMEQLSEIPQVADSFTCQNLKVTVMKMDLQRVVELKVEVCRKLST